MMGLPNELYSTPPELSFIKTSFLQGQITPSEPAIKPMIVASVRCLNFFKTKLKTFENITSPAMDPTKKIKANCSSFTLEWSSINSKFNQITSVRV